MQVFLGPMYTEPDSLEATEFKGLQCGAKVAWPPDMPDDIMVFCTHETQRLLGSTASVSSDPEKESQRVQRVCEDLKTQLDHKYGLYWHVTIGTKFGSSVICEKSRFIYFYVGSYAVMIYKN